ncbi:MAG: hypothetical protein KF774_16130 [Planctomyces sp.]|nr:hypothetical protein [Planctomyces sp.]
MEPTPHRPGGADLSADELCGLMNVVRRRMACEAAGVARGARQLTDWRYYFRSFPGPILAGAAFLGFLAVPRRLEIMSPDVATLEELAKKNRLVVETKPASAAKPGFLDSMVTMAGNVLLRAGLAYARQQAGRLFGNQAAEAASPLQESSP